jgi:putative tricarboxylic transport membrane protein
MGQQSGAGADPVSGHTGAAPAPEPPLVPGGRAPVRPRWLGAAVIAWGLVWLYGALSLPQAATYAVVGPGLFPAIVGGGLVLLGILLLVAVARRESFEPQEAEDADASRPPSPAAFWMAVAAGVIPIFVIRALGFPVAATLAFALTARAFGSRRLLLDLGIGLLLGVACWLLFSRLLGLSLPGFPALGVT